MGLGINHDQIIQFWSMSSMIYPLNVAFIAGLEHSQGIADFENELKTYQGGLKKEAYYFYKRHLDSKHCFRTATERLMVEHAGKILI